MDSNNYLDRLKTFPDNVCVVNNLMDNDGISVTYSKELEFKIGEFTHNLIISLCYDFITEDVTYLFDPDSSFNGTEALNFFILKCDLGFPNPDADDDRAEVAVADDPKIEALSSVISEYFNVVRSVISTFNTCIEYARNSEALRNLPRTDYKLVSTSSIEHDPSKGVITVSMDYLIDDTEFGIIHHLGSIMQRFVFEDGRLGKLTKLFISGLEDQDYSFYKLRPTLYTDLATANLNLDLRDRVESDNIYYDTRHGLIYTDSDSGLNFAFFHDVKSVELVPVEVKADVNFIGREVSDAIRNHFSSQYYVEDAPEYMVVYYV